MYYKYTGKARIRQFRGDFPHYRSHFPDIGSFSRCHGGQIPDFARPRCIRVPGSAPYTYLFGVSFKPPFCSTSVLAKCFHHFKLNQIVMSMSSLDHSAL